jgi:hypothetical protein
MNDDMFLRVDGVTEMYDVLRAGTSVGIVWKIGDEWLADRSSMATPSIRATTREDAAAKL